MIAEFEWRDYLELARRLSANKDEASLRSAVSRAYYYVYHLALARAESDGYNPTRESGSHIDMWSVYLENPVPECLKLGMIGEGMRKRSSDADYRQTFPRLEEAVPGMLADAQQFADSLSKLELRHPKQSSQRR